MKERLLDLLMCPACRSQLDCEPWKRNGHEIVEGLLNCTDRSCGQCFPIIGGVPRMLLGSLRQQLASDYRQFFLEHADQIPGWFECMSEANVESLRTQKSFGFEWTQFSAMRDEWETNFWGYMQPHSEKSFDGNLVLDAGCGMGRHLYYSAQYGRETIGVDFSRAVDAAYHNVGHLPNAHIVQASLLELPFRDATFDFVYSFGVLHHLPCPEDGLKELVKAVKPKGSLQIYLYWKLEDAPLWKRVLLKCVNGIRSITARMPHRLLQLLCYPISAAAWMTFVLPYRMLRMFPPTRSLAESLPLKQYSDYPFGVLLNDQFDRFSAPIENRYSQREVQEFLEDAGLQDVAVHPYSGWVANASKPASVMSMDAVPPLVGAPAGNAVKDFS